MREAATHAENLVTFVQQTSHATMKPCCKFAEAPIDTWKACCKFAEAPIDTWKARCKFADAPIVAWNACCKFADAPIVTWNACCTNVTANLTFVKRSHNVAKDKRHQKVVKMTFATVVFNLIFFNF